MHKKYQNKYRIESNRLQFWDYSGLGKYFITICIAGREEILCSIKNKKIGLSDYGEIVKSEFLKIPDYHMRAFLDELGKFKMQTSKQINILRNTPGKMNWQSNYHDHIIRNNDEYKRIKHYIINNPKDWDNDKFNNINN